jgi:hypothetical protein
LIADNFIIYNSLSAPNAPTITTIYPGDTQATVLWDTPADDGSAVISDYIVEYKLSSALSWSTFNDGTSVSTRATVTGLTNLTAYDFRVFAVNSVGTGYPSDSSSATPDLAAPNPPTNVVATVGEWRVSLSWTASEDNGSDVTDYTIQYKKGSDSYVAFNDGISTDTSTIVTGLTNGLQYSFKITATNGFGTSGPSEIVLSTPVLVTAAAPTATSISTSGFQTLYEQLSGTYSYVDPNANAEGTTTFRWLRADSSGGTYSAIAGATSATYVLGPADSGKYIKFEVTAVSTVSPTTGTPTLSSAIGPIGVEMNYINHLLSTGQSLAVGLNGSPVLSSTQPYSNLMLSGTSLVPLVETSVETMGSAMANIITNLIAGNNYQVAVSNHGVSATGYIGLKQGTAPYANGMDQVTKAKAAATILGTPYRVIGVTVVHGEGDSISGGTASYEGWLRQWQIDYETDVKAITGQVGTIPLYTDQMSSQTGNNMATSGMPLAQLAAAENNPGKIILVGPKYQYPYVDNVHLTNQGYRMMGEYFGKVIKKVAVDRATWTPLSPSRIERSGNTIYAQFNVPVAPLVFDTTIVSARTNYGFEYSDSTSSASISSVELEGTDTVKVTLSATPTGSSQQLRYAYTGTAGSNPGPQNAGSAAGNLRDSDTTTALSGNILYNWTVHFGKDITTDIAVPVVSGVTSTIGSTTASFVWTTGEASSTIVDYGFTNAYGTSTTEADTTTRVTSHSASLSNLIACTTYHYRVRSKDFARNAGTSSDSTFTTSGCSGSAVVESETNSTITNGVGGTVELITGGTGLALTILSGSAGADANFQIKKVDDVAVIATTGVPSTYSLLGSHIYELKALSGVSTSITSFDIPITVDIYYSTEEVADLIESGLKIYRWNGTAWVQLSNCSVDTVANKVSCQTSNFSDFGLFGQDEVIAPTGIAVSGIQAAQITVTWTDNSDNETGFLVEKSTDGNTFTNFTTTSANVISTAVTGLSANTQYWFRVASTNGISNSAYSTTATGKYTLAVAPTSVSSSVTTTAISLNWSGGTASSYNVVKDSDSAVTGQSSSYTYSGLSCGTSYTFKVYGVNGESLVTTDFGTASASTSGCGGGVSTSSSSRTVAAKSGVENSTNLIIAKNGLTFRADDANSTVLHPTLIVNTKINASILIPAETTLTFVDGKPFVGTIPVPTILQESELPKPLPEGLNYSNAIIVGLDEDIFFDKKITITLPISEDLDANNVKIYSYNERLNAYEMVGDGGKTSADGKFISAEISHLSVYVATSTSKNTFTDIIGHWAYDFVTQLYELGVIQGREPNKFVPEGNLTRAEAVKIGLLTYGYQLDADDFSSGFTDLDPQGWYLPYISKAKKEGFIVSGTKFRPDEPITRIDALVMLLKMADKQGPAEAAPFTDISQKSETAQYVNYAYSKGIIQGKAENKFDPLGTITRAEISKIVIKIKELQ